MVVSITRASRLRLAAEVSERFLTAPQVTSPRELCLETRCRQNDTSIGIACVDLKIRLMTLRKAPRSVRPVRKTLKGNGLDVRQMRAPFGAIVGSPLT